MRTDVQIAVKSQLEFLLELDKLKSVNRQSSLADGSRRENSAEHSWHLAMFALVLSEHADIAVDALHTIKLLLVHDIVEIEAGDFPVHADDTLKTGQEAAEHQAAERIFGMLPAAQGKNFRNLWLEFEAGQSSEARFAKALDRLQPLLLNIAVGGGTWNENNVSEQLVIQRYGPTIAAGSAVLWDVALKLVEYHFKLKSRGPVAN